MARKVKIGIAGTHSTGKSSFLHQLKTTLQQKGISAVQLPSLAVAAKDKGFPILRNHTYESTLWIIATCMQQEAEASLIADIILVDRPVIDALAYLTAALAVSGRDLPSDKLLNLRTIVAAHSQTYDLLFVTALDPNMPLAPGRDPDPVYRSTVAQQLITLVPEIAPHAQIAATDNIEKLLRSTCGHIDSIFPRMPADVAVSRGR